MDLSTGIMSDGNGEQSRTKRELMITSMMEMERMKKSIHWNERPDELYSRHPCISLGLDTLCESGQSVQAFDIHTE